MLSLSAAVRVFVAVEPLDMRGSFDALAGAVRRLGLDPVDGHLYLFLNRRRRLAKALWFDGSGWCVLAKRLEAGSFQLPPFGDSDTRVEVDGNTFAAIIAGIDFTAARRGWFRRPSAPGVPVRARPVDPSHARRGVLLGTCVGRRLRTPRGADRRDSEGAGALLAASVASEGIAVFSERDGQATSLDDDGVPAERAGAARKAIEGAVVELWV